MFVSSTFTVTASMMFQTLSLPVLLLAVPVVSSVEYFGWYDADLPVTAAHSNLFQASSVSDAISGKAAGLSSLISIEPFFPGLATDSPDFKSKWEPMVPLLKELLDNNTIIGFNLGDELVWGGIKPKILVQYADTVRASFPRGQAIIWYNEACFFAGPREHWKNSKPLPDGNVSDYTIPAALDWFSIDQYHMDGYVEGWVDAHPKLWYETNIYPNMTSNQKALLVPGSFGSNVNHYPNGTEICDKDCYDQMCAKDATDYYAWGKADPRVVAIAPWNWGGCATCNGSRFTPPHTCCMDEIGTKDQPLSRAAWEKIGGEIKKLGEVAR
jgi:hypothetical protein